MDPITFLRSPSFEPLVPPGPDSVVSAASLSCTVANQGSFQWEWILPPDINFTQLWLADGNRTSIVQISQISAANTGEYTCTASFNGRSANSTTAVQLNSKWHIPLYTRECNTLWGEPEQAIEVCCRLSSTVEDGPLSLTLQRTRPFSQYQDSVIGERIEVYTASCSFMQSSLCYLP